MVEFAPPWRYRLELWWLRHCYPARIKQAAQIQLINGDLYSAVWLTSRAWLTTATDRLRIDRVRCSIVVGLFVTMSGRR